MTYLDTHVVIYLYNGNLKKLSREAARLIEKADQLLISPMVELELEYMYRRDYVRANSAMVVADLRARIGLAICDLPFPLISHESLSITWTEDPFDRMIVAQAAATKSKLITSDAKIRENYPLAVW